MGRNVAIFKRFGAELEYYTGYFSGNGPIVLIKLTANRTSRVSSHFERMIPTHETSQLKESWRQEEHHRAIESQRKAGADAIDACGWSSAPERIADPMSFSIGMPTQQQEEGQQAKRFCASSSRD